VSAVTFPAYSNAAVSLRHMDFGRANSRDQLIRARARVHLRKG
jgi:phage head maturation protease